MSSNSLNKAILVTGIGGNVGQGILRNIRTFCPRVKIVGTNVVALSAGNHLCDITYEVPYAYDSEYLPVIKEICNKEVIDLIIPSTDYEALFLSQAKDQLPCLATSDYETNRIFSDKYHTFTHFQRNNIPFAQTVKPSEYKNEWQNVIVKPREGRGSRDIHVNPQQVSSFSDDYIVQEQLFGLELTSAFYVTKRRQILGQITFVRKLENGATNICIVTDEYNSEIEAIGQKINETTPVKGAFNIQSIATSNGIIPFEINGRISGTNSIRSNFGFKDVEYTVDEYLFNREPAAPAITKGASVRILMDVIYPNIIDLNSIKNISNEHYVF